MAAIGPAATALKRTAAELRRNPAQSDRRAHLLSHPAAYLLRMLPRCGFRFGPALFLYPFRYFDVRRQKWVRARYVAELRDIVARYEQSEIVGPAEVRRGDDAAAFSPWR